MTDHLAAGTQVAQAEVEEARTRLDAMMVAAQGASSAIAHLKGLVDELNVAACNASIASARAANRAGLANDAFGLLSGWTGCEQTLTNHPDWSVKIEQVAERTGETIELAPGGGGESHNLWRYPL